MAEEIDFQGFVEYISQKHVDELTLCVIGNKKERQPARSAIISGAVYYSKAETPQAKKRVQKLTSSILEIIKDFYKDKLGKDLRTRLMIAEITDAVGDIIQESEEENIQSITSALKNSNQEIKNLIKDFSIMPANPLQLMKEGDISKIEAGFDAYIKTISASHNLYPDYGYDLGSEHKLTSVPLSKEALAKYPPNIKFNGVAQVGDVVTSTPSLDVFDYANRHQLSVRISVQEAKKYLGDFEDPIQHEAKSLIGNEVIIPPKPFPKAFPCSITLNETVVFDYILLRTEEILDDGTVVITNNEQENASFRLHFCVNFSTKDTYLSTRLETLDNSHMLQFAQFKKATLNEPNMSVKHLEMGVILFEGKLSRIDYCGDFGSIDEEIDFWNRLVIIEDYFKEKIVVPNAVTEHDMNVIEYISTLISGEPCQCEWSALEGQLRVTQKLKDMAQDAENQSLCFLCNCDVNVSLFGKTYTLKVERAYTPLKIKNFDSLRKELSALDIDDPVKMEFVPDEESGVGTCVDKLCDEPIEQIPEQQ